MIQPLRVRNWMTTRLYCVAPEVEIMSAVAMLVEHSISGLLVIDGAGQLAGILTERDCIEVALHAGYFDEGGGRVRDYMSSDVETVDADLGLIDLAEKFATSSFRRYAVLDDGELVGLIARRDVLKALTGGSWFAAPGQQTRNER